MRRFSPIKSGTKLRITSIGWVVGGVVVWGVVVGGVVVGGVVVGGVVVDGGGVVGVGVGGVIVAAHVPDARTHIITNRIRVRRIMRDPFWVLWPPVV